MFTVTGGTYAYLAFTASNNTIVGTTASASLDLNVERILPSNVGVMVPQLEEYLGSAISDSYNCIDGNGNTVCQVYEATVTNTSTATVKVNGTISFTGIENMPNLKWKRLKNATTVGAYTSYNASTSDAYFERNESFQPGESMTYYFVIWIDETKEVQTDNGTFRVTIEFNPATDEGLTSTIVPISYMTGFSSKDDYSYYRSDTYREKIKNVYFVDYINTTGSVESWDMSDLNMNAAGTVMAWVNTNTTDSDYYDLYIGAEQLIGVINCSFLFHNMNNVEKINFDNFDTRVTISMNRMFTDCSSLISLDVSGFDTSNVTDMNRMFYGCTSLINLDVSGFDTSNVTDMMLMFYKCVNLTKLDVSSFDASNVTNMTAMFQNCEKLTSLDVSEWDTSNVTTMEQMFYNCFELTSLDVSGFDTSNVTNMSYMFWNCIKLTSLDVSNWDTSKVTNMKAMLAGGSNYKMNLEYLDVSKWDTSSVTNMGGMFQNCDKLISLNVSGFDTLNVTDMSYMFNNCEKLITLDIENWNTSKVTNMEGMFKNCFELIKLDVSNFDTSKVTKMNQMFVFCTKLTNLDVSGFDTGNVIDMNSMFGGCVNLISLDVSKWNTSSVTNMNFLFAGGFEEASGKVWIMNLENLDVSKWDTSSVTSMQGMFYNCVKLTSLDVSGFDTSKVTDMLGMFGNCNKLSTNITIKNTGTTTYTDMFLSAATENGASITVNYTSATSSLVDSMIATKSDGSNVVKGSLVS